MVLVVALASLAALAVDKGIRTCPAGGGNHRAPGDRHEGDDGVRLWAWSDDSGWNVEVLQRAGGTGVCGSPRARILADVSMARSGY